MALVLSGSTGIVEANIADNAITTNKIANGAVAAADLASSLDLSSKTLTMPSNARVLKGIHRFQLGGSITTTSATNISVGSFTSIGSSGTFVIMVGMRTYYPNGQTNNYHHYNTHYLHTGGYYVNLVNGATDGGLYMGGGDANTIGVAPFFWRCDFSAQDTYYYTHRLISDSGATLGWNNTLVQVLEFSA